MTEIVVALIAAFSAVCGSYLANSKNVAVLQKQMDLLSERVNKHNNLVERMVAVEQSTKSAHHRIDTLEKRSDKE